MENPFPEIIQAFIINPELNREEVASGTWHAFPSTKKEMQKSLAAIRLDGTVHSKFTVSAYNSIIDGLSEALPENPDLDELNYLSARINEMDDNARSILSATVQTGEYLTLREIINVSKNTDCFYLQPAFNPETLGDFLLENDMEKFSDFIGNLKNSADEGKREFASYIERLETCADKEALGLHKAAKEQGHFTTAGYLTKTGADLVELYNTPADIPESCRVFAYPDTAHIREAIERKDGRYEYTACANGKIKPGDLVLSLPNDEYACLVGTVLEINRLGSAEHDTGNATDDIHVNFAAMEYSERRIGEIEAMFSNLYDKQKPFAKCPLDDVIMAPDNLLKITGISAEKLDAILDSEDKAAAFCKGGTEEDRAPAGPDGMPRAGSPSLVEYLLENKQHAVAQPYAPKRDSEREL